MWVQEWKEISPCGKYLFRNSNVFFFKRLGTKLYGRVDVWYAQSSDFNSPEPI